MEAHYNLVSSSLLLIEKLIEAIIFEETGNYREVATPEQRVFNIK
jgi:hypothetical protein